MFSKGEVILSLPVERHTSRRRISTQSAPHAMNLLQDQQIVDSQPSTSNAEARDVVPPKDVASSLITLTHP